MAGRNLIVPGALFLRRSDDRWGMVIAVDPPRWDNEKNMAVGWRFELLINDALIYTESFSTDYQLVQTDG